MWKDLSFKNRSELMSLFLKQGISSLSDMINIYDSVQDTEQVDSRGRIYDGEQDTINRHNNSVLLKYAGTTYDPVNHIASLDNQIDFNNLAAFGGNLNNQYSGLGNTNMPVLPFLPRIISRLKTNKQSKVEQSNMDNYTSYFDATPELIAQANLSTSLSGRDRKYNINTIGDNGDTHFDVVSRRTRGLYNAMKTKNFSDEEIMRLLPLVVSQNILEGGYRLSRDDNNFGGMMHPITGKRLTFKSEEDFYLNYLDNLDKKWGDDYLGKGKGWRNAKTLKEYADIVNREDLRLHTKDAHTNYNLEHADHPAYLYTPLWENNNTTLDSNEKLGGIYPRVLKMMELLNNRISE